MVFPLIPLALVCLGIGSVAGLAWYDSLTKEQKRVADGHAARLAHELYQRTIDELTREQLNCVLGRVKNLTGF